MATIYGARISPGSISRTGHFISSEALVSVWGAGISSCAGGPTWMLAPVMTSHSSLSEAISSLKIPIRNVESSSLPASFSPSGAGISKTTSAILPAPGNHLSPSWMSPFSTLKMAVVIPASGASPRAEAKSSPGPSQKTAVPSSPNAAAAAARRTRRDVPGRRGSPYRLPGVSRQWGSRPGYLPVRRAVCPLDRAGTLHHIQRRPCRFRLRRNAYGSARGMPRAWHSRRRRSGTP